MGTKSGTVGERSTWGRCFHPDIIDNTINLRSFNLTRAGEANGTKDKDEKADSRD